MLSTVYHAVQMPGPREKNVAVSLNVRVSIRDDFARFCREKGEIQADTLGALIEWFMQLNESTRITVMAKLKGGERVAVAKLALERIIADEMQEEREPPKTDRRARA